MKCYNYKKWDKKISCWAFSSWEKKYLNSTKFEKKQIFPCNWIKFKKELCVYFGTSKFYEDAHGELNKISKKEVVCLSVWFWTASTNEEKTRKSRNTFKHSHSPENVCENNLMKTDVYSSIVLRKLVPDFKYYYYLFQMIELQNFYFRCKRS